MFNKIICPRVQNPGRNSCITIIWTTTSRPKTQSWSPNHFVLCIPIQPQLTIPNTTSRQSATTFKTRILQYSLKASVSTHSKIVTISKKEANIPLLQAQSPITTASAKESPDSLTATVSTKRFPHMYTRTVKVPIKGSPSLSNSCCLLSPSPSDSHSLRQETSSHVHPSVSPTARQNHQW